MNTYQNCVTLITNKKVSRAVMLSSMDVFLLNQRISSTEYNELVALMDQVGLK